MAAKTLVLLATLVSVVTFAPADSQANLRDLYLRDTLVVDPGVEVIQRNNTWRPLGVPFDSFAGVTAYGNSPRGGRYQCTELVHRFLNRTYGIPTRIGIGLGNANVVLRNIYNQFGGGTYHYGNHRIKMRLHANGRAPEPPSVGSAINMAIGGMGHTVIVRYVEKVNNNTVRLYLFEQHGFPRWSPGQAKPIRRLQAVKNGNTWTVQPGPQIGRTIHWLNFKTI